MYAYRPPDVIEINERYKDSPAVFSRYLFSPTRFEHPESFRNTHRLSIPKLATPVNEVLPSLTVQASSVKVSLSVCPCSITILMDGLTANGLLNWSESHGGYARIHGRICRHGHPAKPAFGGASSPTCGLAELLGTKKVHRRVS